MAYVLMWIESLAVSLLLVATLAACIGRWRRYRAILTGLAMLPPLLAYALMSVLVVMLKYSFLLPDTPIMPVLALPPCFVLGAGWIVWSGSRRRPDDPGRPVSATWPRGKLAIGLGVVLAMHLMTFWNLDLAIRNRLETYRADAARVALSLTPPRIADRDNAAMIYREAAEAMGPGSVLRVSWKETWFQWLDGKAPDFDPNDAALREFLQRQAGTVALLHRAAEMPGCWFDPDYTQLYPDLAPPNTTEFQSFMHLLALDARCRAADGDLDTALRDIRTMLLIGAHIGQEPLFHTMVYSCVVDYKAADSFKAVLRLGGLPSTEQLAMLDVGTQASHAMQFERSLRSEEAAQLARCCDTRLEWDTRDAWGRSLLDQTVFSHLTSLTPLYRVFMLESDLAALRREMHKVQTLAALPYYKSCGGWRSGPPWKKTKYGSVPQGRRGILSELLMPGREYTARIVADADARHRLLSLAVAMYRYRAAEGQFPERLDQLMPEWIVAVPIDPFDGQPLKLTEIDGRRVLYSIGPDMADNRGAPMDKENEVGDLTFDLVEP